MSLIDKSSLILTFATVLLPSTGYAGAVSTGGSNLINFTQSTGDGVISNFDRASGTINSLLQQMYANGQRRLRLPIFYSRGGETCTAPYPYTRSYYMDSTGGTLSPQCTQNIVNTLQAIRAQGFCRR